MCQALCYVFYIHEALYILLFNQEILHEHILYVRHVLGSEDMAVNKAGMSLQSSRGGRC